MDNFIKLKLNIPLLGNPVDTVLKLKTDRDGNILDSFYSRRLKDSVLDGCVEIVKEKSNKKKDKS